MNIAVYITDEEKRRKTLEDLQGLFNSNEIFSAKVTPVIIDAAKVANIKTPAKLEQEILKLNPVKPGDLVIIEWGNQKEDIYVSTDRAIFISERVGEFKSSCWRAMTLTVSSHSFREALPSHPIVDRARSQNPLDSRSCANV